MSKNNPLESVLMASNKWRLEMWSLRLHESTPEPIRLLISKIMDRQLELEDEAKTLNRGTITLTAEQAKALREFRRVNSRTHELCNCSYCETWRAVANINLGGDKT